MQIDVDHHYLKEPGLNIATRYWGREMTPEQKIWELGWKASRIIKTVYFEKDSKLYGFVLPLDKQVDLKSMAGYLSLSKREAKRLRLASVLPEGQQPNNAGPFITEKDASLVDKIIFDRLEDKIVDYSYPGRSDVSLHMPYEYSFELVSKFFPGIAMKAFL